ncbi:unnamed protein product [Caenorhabditis auriculariae]|uniref:Protein kinase domain-containing protein n=1 Tax=Caenorhabditis auriculariae TaxID=2777116 RepID=A0A8S1HRF5_9PELO|nr:unnamed protein product [Caenorhabditis auriculariae]
MSRRFTASLGRKKAWPVCPLHQPGHCLVSFRGRTLISMAQASHQKEERDFNGRRDVFDILIYFSSIFVGRNFKLEMTGHKEAAQKSCPSNDESDEGGDAASMNTKAFVPILAKDHKLNITGYLGGGSYSSVAKATFGDSQMVVAAKIIDITPTKAKEDYIRKFLPRETEIVKILQHDNIVRVYQVINIPNHVIFVSEYCANGDLLKKLKKTKSLPEDEAKFMFRQLIAALMHLSQFHIIHRDLKCENIFLDAHDNVKLGDFGFARVLKAGEKSGTFCGSRAYVAPEILRAKDYSGNAVDVWSAGVVLYIMLTGSMPFDDRNPQKMIEKQLAHRIRFSRSCTASTAAKTLVLEVLHPHAPNRPTYKAICDSEWLKSTPYYMKPQDPKSSAPPSRTNG